MNMSNLTDRVQRSKDLLEIFDAIRKNEDGSYSVSSQWTANKTYRVSIESNTCECPDFTYRHVECKHILSVRSYLEVSVSA